MFKHRFHAGDLLSEKLIEYKKQKDVVVVTIPNGGVMCGSQVAKNLERPLEIALINKIFHPDDHQLVGLVSLDGFLLKDQFDLLGTYIESEINRIRKVQEDTYKMYFGTDKRCSVNDKIAIVIDDGIETGSTITLAIDMIKAEGAKKIILGVPVASAEILEKLKNKVDEIVCIHETKEIQPIANFYDNFHPVKHGTIMRLIENYLHSYDKNQ
ncbi:MAG: putative phosphoribosyl transferase [Parvicellaceae bacterium]|jgi:putative phosphoribosyl transferase